MIEQSQDTHEKGHNLDKIKRLDVRSEVGRLRQVILHRPGKEIERMTPANANALLFDDILFLQEAQDEHDRFAKMLTTLGVDVFLAETLLQQALEHPDATWEKVIAKAIERQVKIAEEDTDYRWQPSYKERLKDKLAEKLTAERLARVLIEGLIPDKNMANYANETAPFLLTPIPNLLFTRDPASVVGSRVVISSMALAARKRESLLMRVIFEAVLKKPANFWYDPYEEPREKEDIEKEQKWMSVEGGDLLVIHDKIVLLGVSERTTREALHNLAETFLRSGPVKVVYGVLMPRQRATIHLDTIFTMASEDECMVYAPMILKGGIEQVGVVRASKEDDQIVFEMKDSLLSALEKDLRDFTKNEQFRLNAIHCGGKHIINQDREQWYDGANLLALAPGVVVGYDRNANTLRALEAAGYECVDAQAIVSDSELAKDVRQAMDLLPSAYSTKGRRKFAIATPGYELSRARGGARCMTLPLLRDPVPAYRAVE